MSNEYAKEIAATIAQQLGGYGPLRAMLGADHFVYGINEGKDLGFLTVHFKAKAAKVNGKSPNRFTVKLMPNDTYTVIFARYFNLTYTELKEVSGVYCDQLQTLVEDTLQLRTSMVRVTFA